MTRSLTWLVLLFSLPASAQKLEMRYLKSENLHIANQGGAINWFEEITIELDLAANGKLTGRETGKTNEHDLHVRGNSSYTTEEPQTWTQRWTGTWKQTGNKLALDVALADRKCTHTKKASDGPLEQLSCKPVSPKIHFDCTSEQVTLMGPPAQPIKRDVWRCLPASSPELDRTPRMWTFGKTSCVKTLGAGMSGGIHYESC